MKNETTIRTLRREDFPGVVELLREADAVDHQDRVATVEDLERDLTYPGYHPKSDTFVACEGGRVVGYCEQFLRGTDGPGESVFYTWGAVHPGWRRRGIGRRLLEASLGRAVERLPEVPEGRVHFHTSGSDKEPDRHILFERFGMAPVRTYVNLTRPIDGDLPPVELPDDYRLRPMDPERDVESVWRVDVAAFRDHWGFYGFPLEEFQAWMARPSFRPELWTLAEEVSTGQAAGIALCTIDPDWIEHIGRQEGWVNTLAVLREHRHRGLGTALLAHGLHLLRQGGMDYASLGADSENLTGAVRLYERLDFRVRRVQIAYRRTIRET
jgi:mycothiol synthase